MTVTLTEAAKLTQDKLKKGIIIETVKTSPLLKLLPFQEVVGSAVAYNRENPDAMGNVQFRAPDEIWSESTAEYTQHTTALTSLGGDADVPNIIEKTQSNVNKQMANQVKIKSRLMGWAYEDCAIYGKTTVANQFDGLHQMCAAARSLPMAVDATGAALTLEKLDELLDMMPHGCDGLIMNKKIRRRLTQKLRALGSYTTSRDEYGNLWEYWGDNVPLIATDHVVQTELCASDTGQFSAKTGGSTSSIFAVKFGDDGLCGLQNGGIDYETWEKLESKDSSRTRIKWYCSMVLYGTLYMARICNITDAAIS